jgi:hypothetical protein
MTNHATPLPVQPDPLPYAGTYVRTPGGSTTVRAENGALLVGGGARRGGGAGGAGGAGAGTRLIFYGPDVAYAAGGGGYNGQPYEFIRRPGGDIGWMRINGRIALKQT